MVGTDRSRNVCIEFTAGIKFNVALNYCLIDDNAISWTDEGEKDEFILKQIFIDLFLGYWK